MKPSHLCPRCGRARNSAGTAVCLHVRVSEHDFNQALRGLIALECASRAARSTSQGD